MFVERGGFVEKTKSDYFCAHRRGSKQYLAVSPVVPELPRMLSWYCFVLFENWEQPKCKKHNARTQWIPHAFPSVSSARPPPPKAVCLEADLCYSVFLKFVPLQITLLLKCGVCGKHKILAKFALPGSWSKRRSGRWLALGFWPSHKVLCPGGGTKTPLLEIFRLNYRLSAQQHKCV